MPEPVCSRQFVGSTTRMIIENPVKIRPGVAIRAVLMTALIVLTQAQRNAAQVTVPSAASLDVQVPLAPTPVRINGQLCLAYELRITNYRTIDLALTRIDIVDSTGALLASYEGNSLAARMSRVGARPSQTDGRILGAGMTVVAFVWLALDAKAPEALRHRISYDVSTSSADGKGSATVETAALPVRGSPVVLGEPVRGGPWTALYDPLSPRGHRRTFFAIDGKARIPARFAIDWVKLGDDGRPYHGDPTIARNSCGYGAEVLA